LGVGHDACDWLADRRWGEPDESSELRLPAGITSQGGIDSTRVWFSYYVRYLDQQKPGALTDSERAQLPLTVSAWYELCPFQVLHANRTRIHRQGKRATIENLR
jgi:hypothetical protein